ncbi:MAG: BT4734/BF3469 family protein [Candidatus Hodarchaeales archaeon]
MDLIKNVRSLTEQIKVEADSQKRMGLEKQKRELKSLLPHFSMAKFKNDYRSNDNFEYADHLILDIDKLDDVESVREKFNEDDRTFFDFISISGDGLKVGFWLDQSVSDEKEFKTVCKHYAGIISNEYGIEVDTTFDAARACFISYDEDFYINYECKKLSVEIDANDSPQLSDLKSKSLASSNGSSILNRWAGVSKGERNTTLVKNTGECIRMGIPADIACLTLIEWNKKNTPPLDDDEVNKTVTDVYQRYSDDVSRFLWSDDRDKLIFNHLEFKLFLERQGYYKYNLISGYVIVREENGIVDIVEENKLKENILAVIGDVRKKEYIIARENSIFTSGKLDFLSPFDKKLNEDTKGKCYNYFPNGYVVVTKDSISDLLPYSTLPHSIWKSQIKPREFQRRQSIQSLIRSETFQFVRNVSGKRKDRNWALITALGYLCHFYFDPSRRKAVVLYDETHPDSEGRAEGGKGKSIIGQFL